MNGGGAKEGERIGEGKKRERKRNELGKLTLFVCNLGEKVMKKGINYG